MGAVRQTCLPRADLPPALESSVVEEAVLAQKQHRIVLALGSVVEAAGSQTCRHLQSEEAL